MNRFHPYSVGVCSGWMQVRGNARRRNADAGFAMSDHADWNGLLSVIHASGAKKVFVTHGFQSAFSRYLNETGIESEEVKTEYGDETEQETEKKLSAGENAAYMKGFAELVGTLGTSTKTNDKLDALVEYFERQMIGIKYG